MVLIFAVVPACAGTTKMRLFELPWTALGLGWSGRITTNLLVLQHVWSRPGPFLRKDGLLRLGCFSQNAGSW
jgi:hypothetical protein